LNTAFGEEEVRNILEWGQTSLRDFPWRQNTTPYRILIAEILLRRTTAKAAGRIYKDFVEKYPDLQTISKTSEAAIASEIKGLGYNIARSKILKEVSDSLLSRYGHIPDNLDNLLSIKHIGLYIAAAIASLGYNTPLPMVDSNVIRIMSRFYGKKVSQEKCFHILESKLPPEFKTFNLTLLDLGALICKPRYPLCNMCPIRKNCEYGKALSMNDRNHR
jgi:A/G-specific adenine glycosylase